MHMIDTHCHIQFSAFKDDADEVIKRCAEKNMILNVVGSQKDTSRRAVEYAEKYLSIYATVGLHPIHLFNTHVDEQEVNFEARGEVFDYDYYKKLASHPKVIAIGECGLDFYHLPDGVSKEDLYARQKETFIAQYKLAQELGLPMVIHVREAHEEMVGLLHSLCHPEQSEGSLSTNQRDSSHSQNDNGIRAVIHCYTGNWHYAQKYLDLGLNLGFTGVITFPPKKSALEIKASLLEVVKNCPLDRMLIETDAPYLAPNRYRGKRCEPWMVEEVAKKIAEIKGLKPEEVVAETTKNAINLFQNIR